MKKIIKSMTLKEAEGVDLNLSYGRQYHELEYGHVIEWDNPEYIKHEISYGSFTIVPKDFGITFSKNTILRDANFDKFGTADFNKRIQTFLDKDKELRSFGINLVKRAILFHGPAGVGKTHKINNSVLDLIGDKGISFHIAMSDVHIGSFTEFLAMKNPPVDCDKLFVVMEDLGGGETPDLGHRVMASQDHLLSFLDGNSIPQNWRHIPIVIFSTTNYPKLFLANLIDRPGRFDEVVEVGYPEGSVLVEYAENFMKAPLPDFAKKEIEKGQISIAHVKDALIRNIVYGEPVHTTIARMREWTKQVNSTMEKKEI